MNSVGMDTTRRSYIDKQANNLLVNTYGHMPRKYDELVDLSRIVQTAGMDLVSGSFTERSILAEFVGDQQAIRYSLDHEMASVRYGVAHVLGCAVLDESARHHIVRLSDIPGIWNRRNSQRRVMIDLRLYCSFRKVSYTRTANGLMVIWPPVLRYLRCLSVAVAVSGGNPRTDFARRG